MFLLNRKPTSLLDAARSTTITSPVITLENSVHPDLLPVLQTEYNLSCRLATQDTVVYDVDNANMGPFFSSMELLNDTYFNCYQALHGFNRQRMMHAKSLQDIQCLTWILDFEDNKHLHHWLRVIDEIGNYIWIMRRQPSSSTSSWIGAACLSAAISRTIIYYETCGQSKKQTNFFDDRDVVVYDMTPALKDFALKFLVENLTMELFNPMDEFSRVDEHGRRLIRLATKAKDNKRSLHDDEVNDHKKKKQIHDNK